MCVCVYVCVCFMCVYECERAPTMSTSGALTGYYVDSLLLPESEEAHFPPGPGLLQHARQSALPTERTELGPCVFPSKQPVYGGSGWGHISSVYHSHTQSQPQLAGDYAQPWLLDTTTGCAPLSLTELPTVHHHYPAKHELLGHANGALSSAQAALQHQDFSSGGTDTDAVSARTTDTRDEEADKPNIDPNGRGVPSALPTLPFTLQPAMDEKPDKWVRPDGLDLPRAFFLNETERSDGLRETVPLLRNQEFEKHFRQQRIREV
uniref:Hox9 N-terminal activation domain-containing protein n=1 Tax=Astyanax mexicanus TaxID=7994 RepID=A0A8B9JDC1_ASTMX